MIGEKFGNQFIQNYSNTTFRRPNRQSANNRSSSLPTVREINNRRFEPHDIPISPKNKDSKDK